MKLMFHLAPSWPFAIKQQRDLTVSLLETNILDRQFLGNIHFLEDRVFWEMYIFL